MGNNGSKGSLHKINSQNQTINFVNSSGQIEAMMPNQSQGEPDVFAKFTWNYGGNQVFLTGSFNKWKHTIPLQKQGDQFSITIPLSKGIHHYKFIVDGQWRFSPEDPSIPDANGNINNFIDTSNFHPMIQNHHNKNKQEQQTIKDQFTDKQAPTGVEEFAKNAPKLPPHYQFCSFLKSFGYHSGMSFPNQHQMQQQGKKFEQQLSQGEIMQLFNSPHCLAAPYHVQVDHIIRQVDKDYNCYCITQRFKNKYSTYRYFITTASNSNL